jgi:hypothetical protein
LNVKETPGRLFDGNFDLHGVASYYPFVFGFGDFFAKGSGTSAAAQRVSLYNLKNMVLFVKDIRDYFLQGFAPGGAVDSAKPFCYLAPP